jgi:hypothetical protein
MDKGFTHSGALARITHVETLAALALPNSGGIYDLGMELNSDIPHIPGFAKFSIAFTQSPEGTGKRTWPFQYSAGSVFGALHVGTHMDALIHVQSAGRIFGGSQANEARDDSGWKEYGQETVGPIVGRRFYWMSLHKKESNISPTAMKLRSKIFNRLSRPRDSRCRTATSTSASGGTRALSAAKEGVTSFRDYDTETPFD